jgi:hypothetical protein
MPENYVLLERTELNASAASVTFANIPQTGYTDLKIVMSARTDTTTPNIMITLNGSTSSFTNKVVYGTGSSALSTSYARFVGYASMSTDTASTFGNSEIYIPNYAGSANKSFSSDAVHENNATAANAGLSAGLWSNTAAITSVGLSPDSGNFAANSTFSLYGIAAVGTTPAIAPKASGGNIIATDGTYWYHAFLSSGSFVPAAGLTADVLQIAGGGAGRRGGGGAGGLLAFNSQSLAANVGINVVVGAGGAAPASDFGGVGNNGNNSQFGSLTTSVGGGSGAGFTVNGANGGSGGGAGWGGGTFSGGTASPSGQGNNAAASNVSGSTAGGGGGAGAAGGGGNNRQGGIGSTTYSSWGLVTGTGQNSSGTVYYAGGGSGGANNSGNNGTLAGGLGGGGTGCTHTDASGATSGLTNTGGGGGGGWYASPFGGAGGSGIIIVRYPIA